MALRCAITSAKVGVVVGGCGGLERNFLCGAGIGFGIGGLEMVGIYCGDAGGLVMIVFLCSGIGGPVMVVFAVWMVVVLKWLHFGALMLMVLK